MIAWQIHQYGDFKQVLELASWVDNVIKPGSTLIRVESIGLNFMDILSIAGKYQEKMPLPFSPCVEAAGQVVQAGPDTSFKEGDRVMTFGNSACAEYMAVVPETTFILPETMSWSQGAAFQLVYQTAHMALVHRARLKAGETLLVHAGAGGVGTAAIQIGCALGARVIATAGSNEKLDICRKAGAYEAINYRKNNFFETVRDITENLGVDVVFDPVGGAVFDDSTRCVAFQGRLITIGYASGKISSIPLNRVLLKNIDVIGLFWGNYRYFNPRQIQDTQAQLHRLWDFGKISPIIYREFDFRQLPEALEALSNRESFGKIVLKGPNAD